MKETSLNNGMNERCAARCVGFLVLFRSVSQSVTALDRWKIADRTLLHLENSEMRQESVSFLFRSHGCSLFLPRTSSSSLFDQQHHSVSTNEPRNVLGRSHAHMLPTQH